MEIALNLAWLTISAALLIALGVPAARANKDRSRLTAAIALVCLICLLFPVISMTDDLNCSGPALVETNKLKRLAASGPAILISVSLPAAPINVERRWVSAELTAALLPPLSDAFAFKLSRRPPPLQVYSA